MKRGRTMAIALAMLGLAAGGAPGAETVVDGRALFQGYASTVPAGFRAFPACADCHGATAAGGGEGLLRAPPVTFAALTAARNGEPPYASAAAIRRAVETGEGRGRRPLSGAMPRFPLGDREAAALVGYLKRVGTVEDRPPGVSDAEVRFGTLLPLEGEGAPIGKAILGGLRETFDAANATGGVHGRRIVLAAINAGEGGGEAVLRRLSEARVFALVGSLPSDPGAVAAWQAGNRVSGIAGLGIRSRAAGIDRWSFDLLPPLDIQRSALAAALRACSTTGQRIALFAEDAPPQPSAGGANWFADPASFRAAMARAGGDGCVGSALSGSAIVAQAVPPSWRRVMVLPVPAVLLADRRTSEDLGLWRGLGRASARLAVELLAAAGPVLHERALLDRIDGLNGFEPLREAPLGIRRGARFAYSPEAIAVEPPARPGIADPSRGETP